MASLEKPAESDDSVQDVDPDNSGVQETSDGGAIVNLGDEKAEVAEAQDFYHNLAEDLDETTLNQLGLDLIESIGYDKESRKKRDEQYEEGLRRTGLGDDAPGGASFQGASKVVHPMLTEACVDFSSRMVSELMPPGGPVRTFIPGTPSTKRTEKAERKTAYMNWQFKTQMSDFRTQLEQLATQLPLGGEQYLRITPDHRKKRPVPVFVPIDDVYLPYSATSFYTAERVTYVEHITQQEFEKRVRQGLYRDLKLTPSSMTPEVSKPAKANEKIEGKEPTPPNEDGLRNVYEVMVELEIESELTDPPAIPNANDDGEDDEPMPYLVVVDAESSQVLSIVRNWEEDDEDHKPMFWMISFPFVPWRGAYAIGLTHMIGGLSAAATGALRALLDSAHVNNLPTLMKLKGTNFSGQSKEFSVTSITEIEGGIVGNDDIRKLLMAVPFNPPSAVLYELLGFLVQAGQGVVQTTFENLPDGSNPNMPVGTTLALIEQGLKVFSAIYQRLWTSMDNVIRVVHRINKMYLTDDEVKSDTGEFLAYRSDFQGPNDVIPTADQEVFSEVQRYAQMQMVAQRAQTMPQLYDLRKVELMILKRSKIPDAEELLLPAPEPKPMNAVNENVAMTLGRPVTAFPEQDHLAHIQVLMDFFTSPVLGMLPIIAPTFLPAALNHLKEHLAMWYVSEYYHTVSAQLPPGITMTDIMQYKDPDTEKKMDEVLAVASPDIVKTAGQRFSKIPQIVQQAQQFIQSISPPQVSDPSQAAIQKTRMDNQSREKIAQQNLAQKQQDSQQKAAADDKKLAADAQKTTLQQQAEDQRMQTQQQGEFVRTQATEQGENQRTAADNLTREQINTEDNTTAMQIAAAEIEAGRKSNLSTGTAIGKHPEAGD